MKRWIFFAVLFSAAAAFGADGDLTTAKFQYDSGISVIHSTRMEGEKNLAAQYTNALNTLRAKAQNDGDLDKMKMIIAEAARFEKEKRAPAAASSPDLQKLAESFARVSHDLEVKEAADTLKRAEQFDATLAALQVQFTKAGKIDSATAVQEERKTLAASDEVTKAKKLLTAAAQQQQAPASSQRVTVAAPVKPATTPADAVQFKNSWFRIYEDDIGWLAAKKKCERLGGHLAIIPDEATWNFLHDLIGDKNLWLGASVRGRNDKWTWVDGTEMSFVLWGPFQPNNMDRDIDCLFTWMNKLADCPEDGTEHGKRFVHGYACEWDSK